MGFGMYASGLKFNPSTDIPAGSLSNKVIIVTGGNVGLGRETILQLAKHNPGHIYLAARNKEKADTAITEIQAELSKSSSPESKPKITFLELDLTSFASIKAAARKFVSENDRLDILMNNAGIMGCPAGLTKDGYEIQFGTNHVGHALFTKLLMPTMQETVGSSLPNDVRIINLSSAGEAFAPSTTWTFDKMHTPDIGTGAWQRYGQSKLANIHFTRGLHQHYPNITSIAIHPGGVATNLVNSGPLASYQWLKGIVNPIGKLFLSNVQTGALNQIWAAAAPLGGPTDEPKKPGGGPRSGVFYWPVAVEGKDSAKAKDDKLTQELWEWTEKQLEGHTLDN